LQRERERERERRAVHKTNPLLSAQYRRAKNK